MNPAMPDIPRVYTALAEWLACMVYLLAMRHRKLREKKLVFPAICALVLQAAFMIITGDVDIQFWIVVMVFAVGLMFMFLYFAGGMSAFDTAYYCVRAFVLAELAASLEWQIHCFFWYGGEAPEWLAFILLAIAYTIVFSFVARLEKRYAGKAIRLGITGKELIATIAIGVAVFTISNLSFVSAQTPFSGQYSSEIAIIRTVVDLGGFAILYAYHVQRYEMRMRHELESMQTILKNQYLQYQHSKESIEIINMKYHDLKHQIAALRAEKDTEKRNAYLDSMEEEIQSYEAQNKTGHPVLDTVLMSKSLYCKRLDIQLTCVADGKLLEFMDVMDICTVFGNMLDNAIESVKNINDMEKRLIHLSVFREKDFLMIRCENYFAGKLHFEGSLPATTKTKNKEYHGYGLKSIRYVTKKYDGNMTVTTEKDSFLLKVLIPLAS